MHNNAIIGATSYNIVAGVSVAIVFGSAFFFDLFWPERREDRGVRRAWSACAVFESLLMLSSALVMTVVTARHGARVEGVDDTSARRFWGETRKKPALVYRANPKVVAAVVLAWPGAGFTVARYVFLSFVLVGWLG